MAEPVVSVIVPAFNAAATLGETLAGLAEQDFDEPFEVIVVDNGSSDETAAVAEAGRLSVRLIRKEPGRAGTARNAGAEAAQAPLLAFTDADCRPAPGWLAAGVGAATAAELVQGAVVADPRAEPRPFDRTVWVTEDHGLYETANLIVARDLFRRVGGFEDWAGAADIGVPFGEDTWFGWRARRAGAAVRFAPECVVNHAVFRRKPGGFISERLRAGLFPALVKRIPELRRSFLKARLFLTWRSALFDLALASLLVALIAGSPWPALAALPYVGSIVRSAVRWGRRAPLVAGAELAADATTFAALAGGSARHRSLVL